MEDMTYSSIFNSLQVYIYTPLYVYYYLVYWYIYIKGIKCNASLDLNSFSVSIIYFDIIFQVKNTSADRHDILFQMPHSLTV